MVYKIVFKKRFKDRFEKTLLYIESEFGLAVSQKFAALVERKLKNLQQQPFIGSTSVTLPHVKSILAGRQNRIYYRIEGKKIVVLNMYDTRINPKRNELK